VKNSILIMMGLALAAIPILLIFGGVNFLSKAKEPEPARQAPAKEVTMDGMQQYLLDLQKKQDEAEKFDPSKKKVTEQDQVQLMYLADAVKIQACALNFAKEASITMDARNDKTVEGELTAFARLIEGSAAKPGRGRANIDSLSAFLCKVFADPNVIALRKTEKIRIGVLAASLNYHQNAWDAIVNAKREFEANEAGRVAAERTNEALRIATDRARAIFALTAAASAFAAFMLLAIYLILAKMETNMRDINGSLRTQPSV